MEALEIAASVAEILAGIAILGAAIKAWPVFSNMENRLGEQRRVETQLKHDLPAVRDQLQRSLQRHDLPAAPKEILPVLLQYMTDRGGADLIFEYFPSQAPFPGRISYVRPGAPATERRPVLANLSSAAYQRFIDAVLTLSNSADDSIEGTRYLELPDARFLVTVMRSVSHTVATLRAIPMHVLTIEELRLDQYACWPRLEQILTSHRPSVLVTSGPLGSGKSTTAAALLEYASRDRAVFAATVEYPLEFIQQQVTQLECRNDAEFEQVYRTALQMSPDLLSLGGNQASRFVWDAYGGEYQRRIHAVVTASDAVTAFQLLCREGEKQLRSINVPFLILGQHLTRLLCKACRQPVELSREDEQIIQSIQKENAACPIQYPFGTTFYERQGCNECSGGYSGRTAIIELLDVSQALLEARNLPHGELRQLAIQEGMASLQHNALYRASQGDIPLSDLKDFSHEQHFPLRWI